MFYFGAKLQLISKLQRLISLLTIKFIYLSNKLRMEVNKDLILKLENLTRLELSEQERENIQHDLSNILKMVDKLNELDTNRVEPLVYISEEVNVWREDEVKHEINNVDALRNAPTSQAPYFKVPKVIQKK
jgi:aspartyl-tRNA(Asn)/glutamyl-tRNA(Gln) amidotransferase subunit C